MLWKILEAHGGKLPDDVVACFANTGREMPATLDFVQQMQARWGVPIVWLEYRHAYSDGASRRTRYAEVVSHNSASREGEPFDMHSGNVMAWKHFGVGAEVNFEPSKDTYVAFPAISYTGQTPLTIQSRMTLFDANGIYQPVRTKKVAFQVSGGIGVANLRFYEAGQTGSAIGTSNYSQYFGSNNHFQVHAGVGVQFYLTDHIFLRPQFDIHYVPNLTQYGSNLVTSETVWLGYTFGGQ